MKRRSERIPWTSVGRLSERLTSGDELVQQTGWAFNRSGSLTPTVEKFVATGDHDAERFFAAFGLPDPDDEINLVEIGAGLGRMTSAFTRRFGSVIACDLDHGLLERCIETVGQFGRADRLRTLEVVDGHTLNLAPHSADLAFSYHTFQHCSRDDALALAAEAVRVVRPGGRVVLNFRGPSPSDPLAVPFGRLIRSLFYVPKVGPALARRRSLRKFVWLASRFHPDEVIGPLSPQLTDIEVWKSPSCRLAAHAATMRESPEVARRAWWLVATVT